MNVNLESLNPNFRKLTDLLLFSDRMDLNFLEFKSLVKENNMYNVQYIWDRFQKAALIFWDNSELFWESRLGILLSLGDKFLSKNIQDFLFKRMSNLVRTKKEISLKYDLEYIQFLQLCKVKYFRKESLLSVRNYLTELPQFITINKLISMVHSFIPYVFKDINEYSESISKTIVHTPRNFIVLLKLEEFGIPLDKHPIAQLAKNILCDESSDKQKMRAFFLVLDHPEVLQELKNVYDLDCKKNLIEMIKLIDYRMMEEFHLKNIKNIISLDTTIADEVAAIYIDKLYVRKVKHKKANADRIIRLIKTCPQISAKKIVALLSNKNKLNDIKYIASVFTDLKKLAAFI